MVVIMEWDDSNWEGVLDTLIIKISLVGHAIPHQILAQKPVIEILVFSKVPVWIILDGVGSKNLINCKCQASDYFLKVCLKFIQWFTRCLPSPFAFRAKGLNKLHFRVLSLVLTSCRKQHN